ncbi:DUF4395 domain-containing protein [Nocardioides sp. HDW12B]|uniref:DUF4395 domain-containing protein n=1 Tax=Nocardioides sp. HDW12B TaxID=2714939 RepID=UPI00140DBF27|nr:DUF4395 domain-containing protein [Nocardioides sp. HDW12B]QIK68253.1 DUF4395 domain-containing protein [Nocardioides sp. HDW12B]
MPRTPSAAVPSASVQPSSVQPSSVEPVETSSVEPVETSSVAARPARSTGTVDPRGQRFSAWLTTGLLVAALLLAPGAATVSLLALQLVVFASGVLLGPARTPYAWLFRTLVRPRIGPPSETEDARPPRFAQAVGLAFATVALLGYAAGAPVLGAVAAGMALAAAFLNAAFGFCLGCEVYLRLTKLRARPA